MVYTAYSVCSKGQDHRRLSKDNRWSDMVPPNSALTFAVLWDPEDDIVAFSGADLFDGLNDDDEGTQSPDSPTDAWDSDSYSQVLTIGHSTLPLSEHTATLAFFRDHHDFLFTTTHTPLTFDRSRLGRRQTQTSSTLEGLDVYLRGSMFARTHRDPNAMDIDHAPRRPPITCFKCGKVGHMARNCRSVVIKVVDVAEMTDEQKRAAAAQLKDQGF
ncbi:hypothetical protein D9615_006285 [Tricholomella constricta]|uniref:CCHC-type domain-containing protein n=1 Tax=Tricholomella constricta TaxID=117010 RepID=A0A8H5M484_9AGAR|nr:hypothetical protein D9615_006285 [Tricholomella constricta]